MRVGGGRRAGAGEARRVGRGRAGQWSDGMRLCSGGPHGPRRGACGRSGGWGKKERDGLLLEVERGYACGTHCASTSLVCGEGGGGVGEAGETRAGGVIVHTTHGFWWRAGGGLSL